MNDEADMTLPEGSNENHDPRDLHIATLERRQEDLVALTTLLGYELQQSRRLRMVAEAKQEEMTVLAGLALQVLKPFASLARAAGRDVDDSPGDVTVFLHQSFHQLSTTAFTAARDLLAIASGRLPDASTTRGKTE